MDFVVKYKVLCEYMWNYSGRNRNNMDIIVNNLRSDYNFNENQFAQIKIKLRDIFFPVYNKKWNTVSRQKERFKQKYLTFLNKEFTVKFNIDANELFENTAQSLSNSLLEVPAPKENIKYTNNVGRPSVSYSKGSEKTKKRRIENLLSNYTAEEVLRAAKCLKNQSHDDSDTEDTEDLDTDIKNIENSNHILAMYMDVELTKAKYNKLRIYNEKLYGSKLYPSYAVIKTAKERCYPIDLNFNDSGASVNIKSLLNHTSERILLTLNKEKLHELRDKELVLHGKWGMDGASGQQTTRQNG